MKRKDNVSFIIDDHGIHECSGEEASAEREQGQISVLLSASLLTCLPVSLLRILFKVYRLVVCHVLYARIQVSNSPKCGFCSAGMEDYEDEGEWVPPTEEELKLMEERKKKSDQISAELGRRMLLGWGLYVLLAETSCPFCDRILL